MKRLFALLLSFCMIISVGSQSAAATETELQENGVLLSSLNDDECREFLLNRGVSIPDELSNIDLPELFADLENDPDMAVSLGWTPLANFIEEVRSVFKSHYGISTAPSARSRTYTLQYSTLYSWNATTMPNYNCYAYAIGRTSACQPGDFSNQSYDDSSSIVSVAGVIKDDLNGSLGS